MSRMFPGALLALALALGGCASVPMGDPAQDASLKTFPAPAAGKAGVYVYRNETMGAAVRLNLAVDGQALGSTASKTYFYKELTPGKHSVTSYAENTDKLDFDAVAGKLYFVWQEVKMGLFAPRTQLKLMTDAEGKAGVAESKLAAPN
jgi:hypothetical protein